MCPRQIWGVHPSNKAYHSISFYCDDIHKTVEDLRSRGVEFSSGITDEEWGPADSLPNARNLEVELYQPKYEKRTRRKNVENPSPSPKSVKEENGEAGN
jgi:hypothetical protein